MTRAGLVLLLAVVLIAVAAPWLAPNAPDRQFDTYLYAPPTTLHFDAEEGTYFYPL
jgi:ABC-type antimicrobial peptide transport system permease subunit